MGVQHVIVFPLMAQGHTLPLLDLAKKLSLRGIKVTIFTTPLNSISILKSLSQTPNIAVEVLPFPQCAELPPCCENTDQLPSVDLFLPFVIAAKRLQQPFEQSLKKMVQHPKGDRPLCIISDYFLPWTLESGSKFNIPRLSFSGMNAYAISMIMALAQYVPHKDVISDSEPFEVPGLPTRVFLTRSELWQQVWNLEESNPWNGALAEIKLAEQQSHGVIFNTFAELEPIYTSHLGGSPYARLWCVGPIFLGNNEVETAGSYVSKRCMDWLDTRVSQQESVIYVSFGTQANVPDDQMMEIAWGLESSKWNFILVVRSPTWQAPEGFEERVAGRGLILKEWAPQRLTLAHPAVRGFLTHCGWNSVMEGLAYGVPILAWAMVAEQHFNEKMVVEELGAGIRILHPTKRSGSLVINREVVRERVDELMGGNTGRMARSRAVKISHAAERAVEEGGSSYSSLGSMIDHLSSLHESSWAANGKCMP